MREKLLGGRSGFAFALVLTLSCFAASSPGALITFDLRATGATSGATVVHSKAVSLQFGTPATITLSLYAQVQNLDANHANDAFQTLHTSLVSVEPANGVMGDFSSVTYNSSIIDAGTSQSGTPTNLDANNDLELGSNTPTVTGGYVILNTGASPKFGTGAGAGPTEFFLGTVDYTIPTVTFTADTNLNFALRIRTTGTFAQQNLIKFATDGGAVTSLRGDSSQIRIGDRVAVEVLLPEPAGVALLGLVAALRRRRRIDTARI